MLPTTLDILPDDVLYDVLYHSSVRDILSLRQVSRKFYHVTHHRPIWVNAYARCPILLPPGPFSYQSATDLEQALKKSHLLEANWTSPYPCPVSRQTFVVRPLDSWGNFTKLVGRYLFVAGRPTFRCYDLESKNEELAPIAVYDTVEIIFDCVVEKYSVVDNSDCQFLCAVMNPPREHEIFGSVTLLRLYISQGSAKFELVKKVRLPRPTYITVRIIGDLLAMWSPSQGPMLLHIPTCQVYIVPPRDYVGMRNDFAVTSNHLLCYTFRGSDEILEVFPLHRKSTAPNDDKEMPPMHILTRSHKCTHNYGIGLHGLMLHAERHDDDHSAHYTFVTMIHPPTGNRLGFLDISLESDLVTTAWTNVPEFDSHWEISMFLGSGRAGVSRLVVLAPCRDAIAFTVSEDGDGKRVVGGKPIVVDEKLTKLCTGACNGFVFDGVEGRICRVDRGRMEVISFVY